MAIIRKWCGNKKWENPNPYTAGVNVNGAVTLGNTVVAIPQMVNTEYHVTE